MKNEIRYTAAKELRVQTATDGTRTISGMIPYNSRSVDMGFFEVIAPGAFASALAPGADVLCLRDHDPKLLMGRSTSSTLVLADSPAGLTFRCILPKTQSAMELAESIDRGDLTGVSFGFTTKVNGDVWTSDAQGVLRTLISTELRELSPCSFPAYTSSSVSIRSCPAELRAKLKLAKRTNAGGCDCECPECLDGDCEQCSNQDCEDPNCAESGCPNQDGAEDDSEDRARYMRLQLALRSN